MSGKLRKSVDKLLFLIILFVIVFDHSTKWLAYRFLPTTCNHGIAFGLFANFKVEFISALVILVVSALLIKRRVDPIGGVLVIGGGLSNLIDRFFIGCVLDFIDLRLWPSFNFADAAVCLGIGILIINIVMENKNA